MSCHVSHICLPCLSLFLAGGGVGYSTPPDIENTALRSISTLLVCLCPTYPVDTSFQTSRLAESACVHAVCVCMRLWWANSGKCKHSKSCRRSWGLEVSTKWRRTIRGSTCSSNKRKSISPCFIPSSISCHRRRTNFKPKRKPSCTLRLPRCLLLSHACCVCVRESSSVREVSKVF